MLTRTWTVLACAAVLTACGAPDVQNEPAAAPAFESAAPAPPTAAAPEVFVDEVPPAAQLLFVGPSPMPEAEGRADAVYVPLTTFSVERDGIPNELPPADELVALLEAAGVRDGRVVIVGAPIPAGRAFAGFDYLGMADRAALLDGGLRSLDAAGERSAANEAAPPPATGAETARLGVRPRDDMIVTADWVHARLNDPAVAILDARPPAEFSGETPGDGIERPGHIPGARNLFWQDLVRSADDPRLKEEAELRRLFEQAGVNSGDTVVAYCRTGGQASFLYAVARHLGYDVRLYDGSYIDWSRTEYPVER